MLFVIAGRNTPGALRCRCRARILSAPRLDTRILVGTQDKVFNGDDHVEGKQARSADARQLFAPGQMLLEETVELAQEPVIRRSSAAMIVGLCSATFVTSGPRSAVEIPASCGVTSMYRSS